MNKPGVDRVLCLYHAARREPTSGAAVSKHRDFPIRENRIPMEVTKGSIDGKEEFEQAQVFRSNL